MPTVLSKNAEFIVTTDRDRRELRDAGIFVADESFRQIGPSGSLPPTADTVINFSGQTVLPEFVDTHHHLNQTLARNLPATQSNNLVPWLQARSHAARAHEWTTAREELELATIEGAGMLGPTDIRSLEPGKFANFFSLDLQTISYAGALHDPVAAPLFSAPQSAKHTVVNGRVVVRDGELTALDIQPAIETQNRCAIAMAAAV